MVDWKGPLQFENGKDATLFATLSRTGKISFADGTPSSHAESWAEMHEMGARRIVSSSDGRWKATYDEGGYPVRITDADNGIIGGWMRVLNVPAVSEESMTAMAESPLWGTF